MDCQVLLEYENCTDLHITLEEIAVTDKLCRNRWASHFYFATGRWAKYCGQYVCLSVCSRIQNHMSKFHQVFCTCYPWPWP